ncbi:MAG: aldehyde dehydrogenase, partial [Chloroflexota bacterium]
MQSGERFADRALIGGEWVAAQSGREIEVRNPSTDALITTVPQGDASDAKRAVDAADAALPAWRALPGIERARVLRRLFEYMLRDKDRLAELITLEVGKPIAEAGAEIAYAAGFVEWSAEEAKRIYGEVVQAFVPDKRILVLRQPIGVTAAITPWNLPSAMITRKLGPALAAGCTMIVKAASQTPSHAFILAEIIDSVGVPAGVFNLVQGPGRVIGEAMCKHPEVDMVSFTGSTGAGIRIAELAAPTVKRVCQE